MKVMNLDMLSTEWISLEDIYEIIRNEGDGHEERIDVERELIGLVWMGRVEQRGDLYRLK